MWIAGSRVRLPLEDLAGRELELPSSRDPEATVFGRDRTFPDNDAFIHGTRVSLYTFAISPSRGKSRGGEVSSAVNEKKYKVSYP